MIISALSISCSGVPEAAVIMLSLPLALVGGLV